MTRLPRGFRIGLPLLLVAAIAGAAVAWKSAFGDPKRFGIVAPDRLYRCGEITPRQLERVVQEHSIRSVLSLLDPADADSVAERRAAEELGLRWINVPLRGDGSSDAAARDRIREIVLDDSLGPLLVHCAAGANRTGLACGLYRIRKDGWTAEQVFEEMRRYGFDDLPKHENLRAALREEERLRDDASDSARNRAASQPK